MATKSKFWESARNIALIVLAGLVIWMLFGKPWPSILKTDKDRFLASIPTEVSEPVVTEEPEPTPTKGEVSEPIVTEEPEPTPTKDIGISLDFGLYGEYFAVYEKAEEQWTLGWWTKNQSRIGSKDLADLKREGGSLTFIMPADGWINNSAGQLLIDGEEWTLGNFAEDMLKSTMILKGQTIQVIYGPNNDSAGFQLWFK